MAGLRREPEPVRILPLVEMGLLGPLNHSFITLKIGSGICCLILAVVVTPGAFCGSIVLTPVADTMLIEIAPTNNAGGLHWVNSGSNRAGERTRGLFRFDIAGNIPPQARITSASLSLAVTGIPIDGYAVAYFDLHRVLRNWGEGDKNPATSPGRGLPATTNEATWLSPFALTTNVWFTPGAAATNDYAPAISAAQIVYDDVQSPYTFPDPSADATRMIADIQMWLDSPATNFGWIFICESEATPSTARRFGSREDPSFPPQLTIQYLVPAHIDQAQRVGNQFNLSFTALPDQNYNVQFSGSMPANSWQSLANVAAPPVVTRVLVVDPITPTRRFYRIMTY